MQFETFMKLRFGPEYIQKPKTPENVKKQNTLKTQAVKELMELFSLRQPSVWAWIQKGIPADRAIEIVRHYKFDPAVLLMSGK
jgi:hypothetical protein